MPDIKKLEKLRAEARKLIRENKKNIDSRSIKKYYDLARTGRTVTVQKLIDTIRNHNKPSLLDRGIIDDDHDDAPRKLLKVGDVKKKAPKPAVVRRPVVNTATLYLTVDVTVLVMGKSKKSDYKQRNEYQVKIVVPENKVKDDKIIKEKIKEELEVTGLIFENGTRGYHILLDEVHNYDSIVVTDDFENQFVRRLPRDEFMLNAEFAELDIPGLKDYHFQPFQCVYGALKYKYGDDENDLLAIFQDYLDHKTIDKNAEGVKLKVTDGVTTNMIMHLAEVKDRSIWALDWNKRLLAKHVSKNSNEKSMVYVVKNNHCYLIDDPKEVMNITHKFADRSFSARMSSGLFREYETKNTFTDLPIYENVKAEDLQNYKSANVIYSMVDIMSILINLVKIYNYQVSMENIRLSTNQVTYIYFGKFDLHLYADINYDEELQTSWKDVKQICEKIGIAWNNQAIQTLTIQYEKLFSEQINQRIELTKAEKQLIQDEYESKCNKCSKKMKKGFHFDHIVPLASGGSNDLDNIQLLCPECHFEKSKEELENGDYIKVNGSESSFNTVVRDIFHSDLAKSFAFIENMKYDTKQVKDMSLVHVDMNKTRRNILLHNTLPLPVFTVMDQVEQYQPTGKLKCGMYYVETANIFPLRGNGWYMFNMVQFCLGEGIICQDNIKYQVLSSLTIPPNYFKRFFEGMVANFGDKFNKLGPNAFIGCLNKKNHERHYLSMTSSDEEALMEFFQNKGTFIRHDLDAKIWFIYHSQKIDFEETRMPIYKYTLEEEAIELYRLTKLIQDAGGIIMRRNTDCISAFVDDVSLTDHILTTTFWDREMKIPKYKYEHKKMQIKQVATKCTKEEIEKNQGIIHDIYNNPDLFNGCQDFELELVDNFERLPRMQRTEQYTMTPTQWNVTTDEGLGNDFSPLVDKVMTSNASWFINGPAGTGKSTLAKMIMSKIDDNYVALAPTNKACRIINGITIHKFLASSFSDRKTLRKTLKGISYIIVDEVSMVKEIFYKVFISIKRMFPTIKFILIGDYRQLKPVKDRLTDCDYEHSPALHELCGGNKIQLTVCRRSDDVLFNMCKEENIANINVDAFPHEFTDRHICFTNMKRRNLNNQCMLAYIKEQMNEAKQRKKRQPTVIDLAKLPYDPNSQDVKVMAGMPVIARINCKDKDIANNETFTIKAIDNDECVVTDGVKTVAFETSEFQHLFYLAFAITCHKSQGETYDHPYTIHEWSQFDDAMKYVALSRAKNIAYINIMV